MSDPTNSLRSDDMSGNSPQPPRALDYSTPPIPQAAWRQSPVDRLTIPGRVLFAVTLLVFGAGLCAEMIWVMDNPPGPVVALIMLLLFPAIAGFAFFLVTAFVLQKLGIRTYRMPQGQPPGDRSDKS